MWTDECSTSCLLRPEKALPTCSGNRTVACQTVPVSSKFQIAELMVVLLHSFLSWNLVTYSYASSVSKVFAKMPLPLHCCHPLTSWSWWSLTDLLANGSLFILWVQALSLVGRFQASTCWLLSPLISYLPWLFSPLSCSHYPKITPWILSLIGSLIKQSKQNKQKPNFRLFQLWGNSYSTPFQYLCFPLSLFLFPHQPLTVFLLTHFRFSCSVPQPILSTVDFLSVNFFPRVSPCIPTLFQPTARLGHLANFSRFYVACCLGVLPSFLKNSASRDLLSSSSFVFS